MVNTLNKKDSWEWRGWYVALISAVTAAVSAASASQFSTTLAPLALKLGVTEDAIALSDPLKSAVVVAAMLMAPTVIKKCGWRLVYILSLLSFLIPQSLMPYAPTYNAFLGLKALQGLSALMFPLFLALIMEWNESHHMGLATSIFTGIFYAGGAIGGTIAGFATIYSGWAFSYHILSIMMTLLSAVFLLTVSSKQAKPIDESQPQNKGAYRSVVQNKLTWFLVIAFLPTIWTIQAIWADMVPFGLGLGYSDAETGGIMGISAVAILIAALLSGKASDLFSNRSTHRLNARIKVLSVGTVFIALGVLAMFVIDMRSPGLLAFNTVTFLLSFGAAWGLGAFYCIIPEVYEGEQVTVANGFIGGVADMAMPMSPIVMAIVGIGMNRWHLAWLSCVGVCLVGLWAAYKIIKR